MAIQLLEVAQNLRGATAAGLCAPAIVGGCDNWTAKIEYLYASFQKTTCNTTSCSIGNLAAGPGGFPGVAPATVGLTENMVRAGVNYKF